MVFLWFSYGFPNGSAWDMGPPEVVLQRLARPERRLAPSLRSASAAVEAAGRSLERWVRALPWSVVGQGVLAITFLIN